MRKLIAMSVGLMVLAGGAYAGGRARIVSFQAPKQVTAGQSFQLSFVVRPEYMMAHRKVEPLVTATLGDRTVSAVALVTRGKDRYAATIALPEAGDWTIRVDSRFCQTVMDPVAVRATPTTKS